MKTIKVFLTFAACLSLSLSACGSKSKTTSQNAQTNIAVSAVWARATAAGQTEGAVYLDIENKGDKSDSLKSVTVSKDVAGEAMLHETFAADDGSLGMKHMMDLEIPSKTTVRLEPGKYHVMLMDLAKPLKANDTFKLTLKFEDAGTVETVATVTP